MTGRDTWWDNAHLSGQLAGFRTRHRPPQPFAGDLDLQAYAGLTDAQWRRMAAVHEAGHAVVGMRYGLPLERMALRPDYRDTGAGFTRWRTPIQVPAWHYGVMCAAGERAVLAWLQRSGGYTPQRGWVAEALSRYDRATLTDLARRHGLPVTFGGGGLLDWAQLSGEADQVLAGAWDQVQGLAAAVDTFCDIDGPTAAGIVADIAATGPPDPSLTVTDPGVFPAVWGGSSPALSPALSASTGGLSVESVESLEAGPPARSGAQTPEPAARRRRPRFGQLIGRLGGWIKNRRRNW